MQVIAAEVESPLVVETVLAVAHTHTVAAAVETGNRPLHLPGRLLVPAVAVDTLARTVDTVAGLLVVAVGLAVMLPP